MRKINQIGSAEVLEELRGNLTHLRAGAGQHKRGRTLATELHCIGDSRETNRSHEITQALTNLRHELEITEMGEQLCKFRKRIALSCFYDFYEMAQKNPSSCLVLDPLKAKEIRMISVDGVTRKQAPRQASVVLSRIVDLMFPSTVHVDKNDMIARDEAHQALKQRDRKAAVQKVGDWRKIGKPWSAIIREFGEGALLLLPKSLSDEK